MSQPVDAGKPGRPLNILIVDDSAMMRALIKRVAGLCEVPIANIYEAANGQEAIALLEKHDIQALFTDINMRIAAVAEDLAELLARRDEFKETSSFSCDTFHHALDPEIGRAHV